MDKKENPRMCLISAQFYFKEVQFHQRGISLKRKLKSSSSSSSSKNQRINRRYMTEILLIRRKSLIIQPINQSINQSIKEEKEYLNLHKKAKS